MSKDNDLRKITFSVDGMACSACAQAVEESLTELEGVREVNVNLAEEKATVDYLPDTIGKKSFIKAVEEAGYEVDLSGE